MDQIHLSPLVDQIQLALGHISNTCSLGRELPAGGRKAASRRGGRGGREQVGEHDPFSTRCCLL
jgi:hypothetical protein